MKLEKILFPEQESWTPSLLGHSPGTVNRTLWPVSNKADRSGGGAESVV